MDRHFLPALDRRDVLKWGAAALAGRMPFVARPLHAAEAAPNPTRLTAASGRASLVGDTHPATRVFAYDDKVPGPGLRIRQGRPFRIVADNRLGED
ncbi:MAG: multicopper oxidase family protein, partial [Stellaceae bacterium]